MGRLEFRNDVLERLNRIERMLEEIKSALASSSSTPRKTESKKKK